MRILLLSAYHSASHRYWCEGLMAAFPELDWTLKTQSARHFSWRVRTSGWMWALANEPEFSASYDLVIATSLTDLATLKAFCPALQGTPVWIYFHENQFAHPLPDRQWALQQIGWQFQSIQNALCADHISFNTTFNRETFLAGARSLLRKFPEKLPGHPLERLTRDSEVLPVPLTDRFASFHDLPKRQNLILWNHRWEWDKRPAHFLRAVVALHKRGMKFELAMLGSGGGRKQGEFEEERRILRDHLVHWGEADETTYARFVGEAGIGASTAIHDFQGLAMLELAQAGATVVVPDRLAYPECLPGASFYQSPEADPEADRNAFEATLERILDGERPPPVSPSALPTWKNLAGDYCERIAQFAKLAR